jgi:predicted transposase YbfD/YdcC
MGIFDNLQEAMKEVEKDAPHNGYWYCISDALVVLVCGMMCSLQTIDDVHDWSQAAPTRRFLEEQFGIEKIPCRAQFYNILACVDAEKFNRLFTKWMKSVLQGGVAGKTIAIDGKTVCSTDKLTENGSVLHIASAIVSEHGLVIGSRECGTKTGEITAFRELIEMLDVSGAVVVADALHCNQKSAKAVVEAGADYLFVVKDNVPALKANIELYIHNEPVETHTTTEKNGGRIEKRTAYACCDIDWLDGRENWKNLSCIGAIHREFEAKGKKSSEWHYYISSAPLTAKDLLKHARLEWGVEAMHWLLDVHFNEDKTRVWDMNLQKTLNILRKIALNLARDYKAKTSSKSPISGILKKNLFDLNNFAGFLDFFTYNACNAIKFLL